MSAGLRVLIADDEFLIADYVASIVEDAGHEVVGIAATADDALAILKEQSPDVAILDIRLKGPRDGIDIAIDMQALGLAIPHVFITGNGDPDTRTKAAATQPLGFLQKPFDERSLLSVLGSVAKTRQA